MHEYNAWWTAGSLVPLQKGHWAAWIDTWLLINLTPKGGLFSFLFFSFLFFLKKKLQGTAGRPHICH